MKQQLNWYSYLVSCLSEFYLFLVECVTYSSEVYLNADFSFPV